MSTETEAAAVLDRLLAQIPATGSAKDRRIRAAIAAAAAALETGQDPLEAAAREYGNSPT